MKKARAYLGIATLALSTVSHAAGTSGQLTPTNVSVEGGQVYLSGAFANPDGCAASNVVLLVAINADELNRMMSIAMTAIASGKKISMWLSGCVATPWGPSAPKAVSMALVS